ncbi:MAG: hypothetical protein AAGA97_04000 [Pseudomonadota bacterium]
MKPVLTRALVIAAIVAPILTIINQWEAVQGQQAFSVVKMCLTALVPFCVSLVSGWLAQRGR